MITTCSPHNFPFVKSLGVTEAFDYKDPECGKKVRSIEEFIGGFPVAKFEFD